MEIFETSRLLLRARTPEDFDACLVMDRDPEVIRYVGAPWSNSDEHVAFLRRRLAERFPTGLGYWAIAPREEPAAFLGWVMLCPCTVAGAEVEIGWRLIRAAWGRGYATEAAAPNLAQGFATEAMTRAGRDITPATAPSPTLAETPAARYTTIAHSHGPP